MTWRPLTPEDIPSLHTISNQIHKTLPERAEVFAERLTLYPQGCLALEQDNQLKGYAISHPIRHRQPPALDTFLGEIPPDADQYYIHDVAVLPELRGRGIASEAVKRLLGIAAEKYGSVCLVSVYGTEGFWGGFGFAKVDIGVGGYGESVFLERL